MNSFWKMLILTALFVAAAVILYALGMGNAKCDGGIEASEVMLVGAVFTPFLWGLYKLITYDNWR